MKAYVPEHDLYRYTRFRKSVEELLNSLEDSPVQILACKDFKITPKQFFEEEYWIPIKLRIQGREGETPVEATSYKEVLFSSQHSDICLILGNTGAGKTTWQLKAVNRYRFIGTIQSAPGRCGASFDESLYRWSIRGKS